MLGNYLFSDLKNIEVQAKIQVGDAAQNVVLTNVRPVGFNHRNIIWAGDYEGVTYYNSYNPLMSTFLVPGMGDKDRFLSQHQLWQKKPTTDY